MFIDYHCAYVTLMRIAILPRTTLEQRNAVNYRRRVEQGKPTRFTKGHVPWTKGRKGLHMSPATEFKPGCLRGKAARNWRPVGTVTIRYDHPPRRLRGRKRKAGLPRWRGPRRRWIKVRDHGPPEHRWVPYARYLWERANGPIPKGMCIVHVDGDILHDALSNLRMVTDSERYQLQAQRDPGFLAKARSARRRRGRRSQVAIRRHLQAARRAREETRGGRLWECDTCGYDLPSATGGIPDRCRKCNGSAFQAIDVRSSA